MRIVDELCKTCRPFLKEGDYTTKQLKSILESQTATLEALDVVKVTRQDGSFYILRTDFDGKDNESIRVKCFFQFLIWLYYKGYVNSGVGQYAWNSNAASLQAFLHQFPGWREHNIFVTVPQCSWNSNELLPTCTIYFMCGFDSYYVLEGSHVSFLSFISVFLLPFLEQGYRWSSEKRAWIDSEGNKFNDGLAYYNGQKDYCSDFGFRTIEVVHSCDFRIVFDNFDDRYYAERIGNLFVNEDDWFYDYDYDYDYDDREAFAYSKLYGGNPDDYYDDDGYGDSDLLGEEDEEPQPRGTLRSRGKKPSLHKITLPEFDKSLPPSDNDKWGKLRDLCALARKLVVPEGVPDTRPQAGYWRQICDDCEALCAIKGEDCILTLRKGDNWGRIASLCNDARDFYMEKTHRSFNVLRDIPWECLDIPRKSNLHALESLQETFGDAIDCKILEEHPEYGAYHEIIHLAKLHIVLNRIDEAWKKSLQLMDLENQIPAKMLCNPLLWNEDINAFLSDVMGQFNLTLPEYVYKGQIWTIIAEKCSIIYPLIASKEIRQNGLEHFDYTMLGKRAFRWEDYDTSSGDDECGNYIRIIDNYLNCTKEEKYGSALGRFVQHWREPEVDDDYLKQLEDYPLISALVELRFIFSFFRIDTLEKMDKAMPRICTAWANWEKCCRWIDKCRQIIQTGHYDENKAVDTSWEGITEICDSFCREKPRDFFRHFWEHLFFFKAFFKDGDWDLEMTPPMYRIMMNCRGDISKTLCHPFEKNHVFMWTAWFEKRVKGSWLQGHSQIIDFLKICAVLNRIDALMNAEGKNKLSPEELNGFIPNWMREEKDVLSLNEAFLKLRKLVGIPLTPPEKLQADVWLSIVDNCDALCRQTYVQFWNTLNNFDALTEIRQILDTMSSLEHIKTQLCFFEHSEDTIANDLLQLIDNRELMEFDDKSFSSISESCPNIVSLVKAFIICHRLEDLLA